MKIVFVGIGVESLAIEFLSSFLKSRGYETDLVFDPTLFKSEIASFPKLAAFFDTKKEIAREIISKNPDVVGFSVFTLNYQRALELAGEIKKLNKNLPIVFGGIHPTSVPEIVIKEKAVDIVCVGEGEEALSELLESLKMGKKNFAIRNLWFKKEEKIIANPCRPLLRNLDALPFPDKNLFYRVYPGFIRDDYYAITSRGCPFSCSYCANNVLRRAYRGLGNYLRRRSPKNIIEELILAKKNYRPKKITFADDVFVQDLKWLKEFSRLYKKKVGLPYVMLTHPRFVTRPIAKLLASSGCFLLMFGIQSASETTRRNILKRFETNREIERAAKSCHRAGLRFSVDHIFNIPGEELKNHEEALRFYSRLSPAIIHSYWLQYFPRTEIIQEAIKRRIIKKSQIREIEEGRTSTSLVVGFGGKDTFSPKLVYTNLQLLFTILPLLPKRLLKLILRKKLYLLNINPPLFLNFFLKFFVNLLNRRAGVYLGIVKTTVYFLKENLKLKWRYQRQSYAT